jgi:hypothetical protein
VVSATTALPGEKGKQHVASATTAVLGTSSMWLLPILQSWGQAACGSCRNCSPGGRQHVASATTVALWWGSSMWRLPLLRTTCWVEHVKSSKVSFTSTVFYSHARPELDSCMPNRMAVSTPLLHLPLRPRRFPLPASMSCHTWVVPPPPSQPMQQYVALRRQVDAINICFVTLFRP